MDNLSRSIFPLARDVTREQLRSLCQVMWQWELCHDCKAAKDCGTASCPWQQAPNLEAFFQFYREVTASYVPERPMEGTRALSSHDDLIAIISTLKNCSQAHRHVLTRAHFAQRAEARAEQCLPLPIDQDRAFSLAARVLAMVNSSAEHQADGLLESGMLPLTWQDDRSFSDFMETAFPLQGDEKGGRESPRQQLIPDQANKWPKLTAKRLKKMAGLELVATDNLQNHLRLDAKHKTVEIYHYTSVLKENLLSSVHCDSHDDTARGISEGNMPRELALETLATIKEILFPLDADSQALLRTLVSKKSFDPDCLRVDTRPYRRPDECKGAGAAAAAAAAAGAATLPHRYWGARLSDLCEHMETPTPSGHLERWMERRSGARHVMMATLGGVVLAVLLGAASLAVSIFQAWVGYQQWQHPMNPS